MPTGTNNLRQWRGERETEGPIPFGGGVDHCEDLAGEIETSEEKLDLTFLPGSAGAVMNAIENMSRRIDDLARELHCLGWFDDDDEGPRAA